MLIQHVAISNFDCNKIVKTPGAYYQVNINCDFTNFSKSKFFFFKEKIMNLKKFAKILCANYQVNASFINSRFFQRKVCIFMLALCTLKISSLFFFQDTLIKDVQTNSKLGPLVPLLVSFVGNGVQRHSENQTLVRRLLYLIEAIFLNPYLNLSPKPFVSNLSF